MEQDIVVIFNPATSKEGHPAGREYPQSFNNLYTLLFKQSMKYNWEATISCDEEWSCPASVLAQLQEIARGERAFFRVQIDHDVALARLQQNSHNERDLIKDLLADQGRCSRAIY